MFEAIKYHWEGLELEEQEEALRLLSIALHPYSSNFTSRLLNLAFKADVENTYRLFEVYPTEVAVVQAWKNGWVEPSRLKSYC